MEVIYGGELFKSKSSNGAPGTVANHQSRNLSANDVGHKMELGKKRGVYVEKWVNAKHAEDKKTPIPQSHKLLTSAPAESKIPTFTQLLGTVDPVVRFIKRKPKKTLPEKSSKHSSKTCPTKPSKPDMPGNLVEENKKSKKSKSNAQKLKRKDSAADKKIILTPSSTSGITRQKSYEATWSAIFPKKESSLGNTHLLQQYVCNYEQTVVETNKELDEKSEGKGTDEPIYNFFIDLLESVYDDDIAKNSDTRKSSDIELEIDDHVAQKLLTQEESSNHYTIKDERSAYDQSRQLAAYYNKSRLVPLEPVQRRKKKCNTCINKPVPSKSKPKKSNLLNLLKQQLSLNLNMDQEPESMYEALLNIANKRKRKLIYFEATEEHKNPDRVCRFKRRKVISPSTRLPKHIRPTVNFNSINTTREKYRTGSVKSSNTESRHSLEVLGFDYDETDFVEPDTDDSEVETAINVRNDFRPVNLNEGIRTVTQYWKR